MSNSKLQFSQMDQIAKMKEELLGNAKSQVSKHAEMAKLMEMESPFMEDEEIQSKFRSVQNSKQITRSARDGHGA